MRLLTDTLGLACEYLVAMATIRACGVPPLVSSTGSPHRSGDTDARFHRSLPSMVICQLGAGEGEPASPDWDDFARSLDRPGKRATQITGRCARFTQPGPCLPPGRRRGEARRNRG